MEKRSSTWLLGQIFIWDFNTIYSMKIIAKCGDIIHQTKALKKPRNIKKDKIALKTVDLMVRPDGI